MDHLAHLVLVLLAALWMTSGVLAYRTHPTRRDAWREWRTRR